MKLDELLKPSLGDEGAVKTAMYSTTAGYVTAFFGGPFAAIALTAVNSSRLRRLRADAPVLLAMTAFSVLVIAVIEYPGLVGLSGLEIGLNESRMLHRGFALALFGVSWLIHRRFYRNMAIMGIEPRDGWAIGLGCILLGNLLTLGLVWLLTR